MFRVRHELTLNTPVIYSLENSLLELEINMFRVRQETILKSGRFTLLYASLFRSLHRKNVLDSLGFHFSW